MEAIIDNKSTNKSIRNGLLVFHESSNKEGFLAILKNYLILSMLYLSIFLSKQFLNNYVFILPYIVLSIIIAGRYNAFYMLTHEAAHYNLFKTKKLNNYLQFLFTFPIFLSIKRYREWHSRHHKYLGDPILDSENIYKKRWLVHEIDKYFNKIYIIRPLTLFYTYDFIRYCVGDFIKSNDAFFSKLCYWVSIVTLISFFQVWGWFTLFYIIPMFIFYPIIDFLASIHEHAGTDRKHIFRTSRNNFGGFLNNFLLHPYNDNFHMIHHFDPAIPFYKQDKAYEFIKNNYEIDFVEAHSVLESVNQAFTGQKENKERGKSFMV
jgi:fatty acid desaturase